MDGRRKNKNGRASEDKGVRTVHVVGLLLLFAIVPAFTFVRFETEGVPVRYQVPLEARLHEEVRSGNVAEIKRLIRESPESLHFSDFYGTPLENAARFQHQFIVDVLVEAVLENGGDPAEASQRLRERELSEAADRVDSAIAAYYERELQPVEAPPVESD